MTDYDRYWDQIDKLEDGAERSLRNIAFLGMQLADAVADGVSLSPSHPLINKIRAHVADYDSDQAKIAKLRTMIEETKDV